MSALAGVDAPPIPKSELEDFFAGISSRIELQATNIVDDSSTLGLPDLMQFFSAVSHKVEQAEEQQRRLDKQSASRFNVFDLIEPDENKLSDILAGLLDPNGTHGQGGLFLGLLFRQVGLDTEAKSTEGATVQREAPTHGIQKYRRRMDVLVEAGALLAIENKVDAAEQSDQVKDYLEHLNYCARGRSIKSALIYLTPDGRSPESLDPTVKQREQASRRLHCWSYQVELCEWLESCREQCAARKIQYFLSDFLGYIKSELKRESQNNQEEETDEN